MAPPTPREGEFGKFFGHNLSSLLLIVHLKKVVKVKPMILGGLPTSFCGLKLACKVLNK
jgi:hypothetical protein